MKVQKNVALKKYTTFKIGGPAKFFCEIKNKKELAKALNWAKDRKLKVFILGGGSNVLFMDEGFNGLVIKINNQGCEFYQKEKGEEIIKCQAGTSLQRLVNFCFKHELTGLEWATGIPGTVGGAIRGNAGAFGGEIKDVINLTKAININGSKIKSKLFPKELSQFDYRTSFFKKNKRWIIWEGEFNLKTGEGVKIKEKMKKFLTQRNLLELNYPSAGSIFKNPVVSEKIRKMFEKDKEVKCRDEKVPAGWLIDQVGLKGKKIGGARISKKQANIILNEKDAQATNILMLISLIKTRVRNEFGIQLNEEIQIIY